MGKKILQIVPMLIVFFLLSCSVSSTGSTNKDNPITA